MIPVPANVRVWLASGVTDMRILEALAELLLAAMGTPTLITSGGQSDDER